MKICMQMLTFNRLPCTKITLENYFKTTKIQHDLIVWDNGSKDGTVEWLREAEKIYPIKLFLSPSNMGFVEAVKQFMKVNTDYDFVGHIDNDIYTCDSWLENFIDSFNTLPDLGIVGGSLVGSINVAPNPIQHVYYTKLGMQEGLWLARRGFMNTYQFCDNPCTGNAYSSTWNYFTLLAGINPRFIAYDMKVTYETPNIHRGNSPVYPPMESDPEYYKKIDVYRRGTIPQ